MNFPSIARRTLGVASVATVFALSSIMPASAHVTVSTPNTAAGAYTLLTFAFSHGCEGAATTQLAIEIPDSIETVRPARSALWTIELVVDTATPVAEGEHAPIDAVIFTSNEAVQDGIYDSVSIQVRLPEEGVGETLYFPTIQTCETGETAWVQIPAEGASGEELEAPAPSLVLTEAAESGS